MDNKKIGQYIALKRKEKGMTQKQLADALLVTNKAVSKWETGSSMPDISLLKDLAMLLGVTVDELLNGEDDLPKEKYPEHHYQTLVITKSMYKAYLQQLFYDRFLWIVVTTIIGVLLICGGFSLYLLNRYLQHHLDVIGLVMIIIGIICLSTLKIIQFLRIHFYKSREIQYQLNQQTFDYIQDSQKISYYYQDIQDIWFFETFIVFSIQKKKFYFFKEDVEFILQHSSAVKHDITTKQEKIKLWVKVFSLLIFVLLTCLELGYVVVLKRIGFEYIFDVLEWIVIVGMILTLVAFLSLDRQKWNRQTVLISVLSSILLFMVLWFVGNQFSSYQTYYSLSSDLSNQLVLKQDKITGQMKDLHYTFLCFGKSRNIYDTNGQSISTLWMNGDNNLVRYYDHNNNQKVFVATYGDRGNGISYYYVVSTLSGNWITKDNQDKDYSISVNQGIIKITDQGNTLTFDSSRIEQFGTTAILCKDINENPSYVIALNKNCQLNDKGLVDSNGTITIVNIRDMVPVELFCTTYKENPLIQQQINEEMEEKANKQITDMKEILNDDMNLKGFRNTNSLFKVETLSQDFFEVTRLAYQIDTKEKGLDGFKATDQIKKIEVQAGTIEDFYVEVEADTWLENISTGEVNKNGYIPRYRIMQGDGCYLVRKMEYRVPGDVYLVALSTPLEKDVSNEAIYRFER